MTAAPLPDGGLVVAGITRSHGFGRRSIVLRLDQDGNQMWQKILGNTGDESIYASAVTSDGKIIVGGSTDRSFESTGFDAWVACLDFDGNQLWERTYDWQGQFDQIDAIHTVREEVFLLGRFSDNSENLFSRNYKNFNGRHISFTKTI